MSNVKKILSVILILALALMSFGGLGGCQKKTGSADSKEYGPIKVFVDIENAPGYHSWDSDKYSNLLVGTELMTKIQELGGPEIEIVTIPREGNERQIELTRIRTEMMAGEGPDVFIVSSSWEITDPNDPPTPDPKYRDNTALFLQPEKSMALGLFYPLDDLIEDAQFMEWDKLTPQIMEAGRTEQWGQVLLPLVYQISATVYDGAAVEFAPSKEGTFAEAIQDPTGIQRNAVAWSVNGEDAGATLGALADYTASPRQLLFTEDELTQWLQEGTEIYQEFAQGAYDDLPENLGGEFCIGYDDYGQPDFLKDSEGTTTFVPAYNRTGGATAIIPAFAAINANTKEPDSAFFVLDYLLSKDSQNHSAVFKRIATEGGLLTYEGLMSEDEPFRTSVGQL